VWRRSGTVDGFQDTLQLRLWTHLLAFHSSLLFFAFIQLIAPNRKASPLKQIEAGYVLTDLAGKFRWLRFEIGILRILRR
jgi:hypothetical protein